MSQAVLTEVLRQGVSKYLKRKFNLIELQLQFLVGIQNPEWQLHSHDKLKNTFNG